MDKKIITVLLIIFLGITSTYAQNVSFIVLKGGDKVKLNNKVLHQKMIYDVNKDSKIIYDWGCNLIFYQGAKFFNFVPKNGVKGTLTFQDIIKRLNGKVVNPNYIVQESKAKKSKNFFQYLFNYEESSEKNDAKGVVYGGIKGLNGNNAAFKELDEYAVPSDSTKTALNSIELFWKFPNKLNQGKLIVTNTATNKVLLNKAIADTGSEVVLLDGSGWYEWEIISGLEHKVVASNSFVVLTPEALKIENDNLNEFKSSIAEFDIETQQLLIEDYMEQKQLILN